LSVVPAVFSLLHRIIKRFAKQQHSDSEAESANECLRADEQLYYYSKEKYKSY